MKQERVIAILDFYRDIDKTVTMNEWVIRNLEDQYYSTLGAVNSDGMPHGKGGVSNPVERVVLNVPQSVSDTIANMRRENERLTAIKGEILSELNALNYREKADFLLRFPGKIRLPPIARFSCYNWHCEK